MNARFTFTGSTLALALLVSGCGSDDASGDADTGVDVTEDASGDTIIDDDVSFDIGGDDTPAPDAGDDVSTDSPAPDTGDDTVDDDTGGDDVGTDTPLPSRCDADGDCNDGLACTTDACVEGTCTWTIADDACFVRGVCYDGGDADPGDPCSVCDPASNQAQFVPAEAGAACDDGNICTADDVCLAGVCTGEAVACNDGNACTDDVCDPALGCTFPAVADGTTCDDTSACTENDRCEAGTCVADPVTCDDGDPCTTNSCDPDTGCVETLNTAVCEDGNACTTGDICADGECASGGPTNCDDGNLCTIDVCDDVVGCVHLPNRNPCCEGTTSICDDGDPCTTDICDPESGACFYENNAASCNDGNACTTGDVCADGACTGTAITCNDGDPCTDDVCNPASGCGTVPLSGPACDDGISCTLEDICSDGLCVAGIDECFCEPVLGQVALRITSLEIPPTGNAGDGLNIDGEPTCAPAGRCADGVDNAMGPIGGVVNGPLADALDDGSLVLVVDLDDLSRNPLRLGLVQGELDPANAECDITAAGCDYLADPGAYDPETCAPVVALPTTRAGASLTAGSPDAVFPLSIPFGDTVLTITLYAVQLRATLQYEGEDIVGVTALLGGAVPLEDLLTAIDSLPPDTLPIDPESIRNLLTFLVTEDQTIVTPDGRTRTAASIGLRLEGVAANWSGVLE